MESDKLGPIGFRIKTLRTQKPPNRCRGFEHPNQHKTTSLSAQAETLVIVHTCGCEYIYLHIHIYIYIHKRTHAHMCLTPALTYLPP